MWTPVVHWNTQLIKHSKHIVRADLTTADKKFRAGISRYLNHYPGLGEWAKHRENLPCCDNTQLGEVWYRAGRMPRC